MKSCITLVLLLRFLPHNTLADEDNALEFIPINVMNVTMPNNGSVVYPDIIVLLPHYFSDEQRAEFMNQLAEGIVGDIVESPDNALRADTDADVTGGVDAALVEAARQIQSLNTPRVNLTMNPASDNTTTVHQIYAVVPTVEEEYIRKKRSLGRLAPLLRQKRTLKKHSKGSCMICQLLQPQSPTVINIYHQGGCGGGCQPQKHYQQPSCGQPQCGYHPQPPPVYHPPPQQQTCDRCSHQPSYQQQQPAYYQPSQHYPSGSHSQSSAQSSASSSSWGKKK